jgi:hypothetical protein
VSRTDVYEKNTKEQYEALGRFVEAFEAMVNEARVCCIDLLGAGLTHRQQQLIAIPLHHQSFSAKPVFDTFRAVFFEVIADKKFQKEHRLAEADVKTFSGVLGAISGEYGDLTSQRNNLLHGTWFIGYRGPDNPDASIFYVNKFTTSSTGLRQLELPKTATELDALRSRCEQARTWINTVHGCLPTSRASLTLDRCFKLDGKIWERIWPSPHRFAAGDS